MLIQKRWIRYWIHRFCIIDLLLVVLMYVDKIMERKGVFCVSTGIDMNIFCPLLFTCFV